MVAGLQEHRWSQYTSYSRTDLVNASVPICWETHINAFNSSGGTDISGGVAGDMCSGEQKIRGNTYLRYTGLETKFIIKIHKILFLSECLAVLHCTAHYIASHTTRLCVASVNLDDRMMHSVAEFH